MSKIDFYITSAQGEVCEREAIILYLRCNGRTVNAVNSIECFKNKASIKNTLDAFISCALNELFPEKVKKCEI